MTVAAGRVVVLEPGLLTTVQDLGRPGLARFGVSPGGALDRAALILGNRLVGNDPGEAGLEITLLGPRLVVAEPAVIALTGADLGAMLGGASLPRWQPIAVRAGDELSFRPDRADGRGTRAYLCVAGGFALEPVMGSRSTDLSGRFGGLDGRALQAGDKLPLRGVTAPTESPLSRSLAIAPSTYEAAITARVVLGPQLDRFTADGVSAFLGSAYVVSAKADRTGVRLTGPPVTHTHGADLLSEGIAHGAIQVPGDGQPIVLLAARQTVGGYVKIATVVGADLDAVGQLRPGNTVRFAAVDPAAAREATLAYHAALGDDAVTTGPSAFPGWTPGPPADGGAGKDAGDVGDDWDPAAVIRVIEALKTAGVTAFRLEVAAAGLKLELRREANGELTDASTSTVPSDAAEFGAPPAEPDGDSGDLVAAPLLGVFYRRSAPDGPPLVEVGAQVTAGQAIGVIEVMKTYHEVTSPRDGIVAAFLVEDGQFVEYGQPLARLASGSGADLTTESR